MPAPSFSIKTILYDIFGKRNCFSFISCIDFHKGKIYSGFIYNLTIVYYNDSVLMFLRDVNV